MKDLSSEGLPKASSVTKQNPIDWNDHNYPICFNLFHFDSKETPEVHRCRVLLLRINHNLITIATLLNLIANCIGLATGVPDSGPRVGITVFLSIFWVVASLYLFIYAYHIIMKDEGSPLIFYGASLFTAVWFFIWSIADFADANGFVEVAENFKAGREGVGFVGLVTALSMLGTSALCLLNIVMFHKR